MKSLYKTKEDFLFDLKTKHPKKILLAGRSCTGKSTLAGEIKELDYGIVELDHILIRSVRERFLDDDTSSSFLTVYRNSAPLHHMESFISETKKEISQKLSLNNGVLLDGTVANNELISQLFSNEEFLFVFLLPENIVHYIQRIQKRFEAGIRDNNTWLPRSFFERFITKEQIAQYIETGVVDEGIKKSFENFAKYMIESSQERLEYFKERFQNLTVISV